MSFMQQQPMHILWLCSWYPNQQDPFDGDFIQRHARAVAGLHPLRVIHLLQNPMLMEQTASFKNLLEQGQLWELIVGVKPFTTGWGLADRLIFNQRYISTLRKLLDQYIREHGVPHLVHLHVPVKMGAGALYLQQKLGIPFVVTEHTSAYFSHIPFSYHTRNRYFRTITRHSFQHAAAVISVSDFLAKRLQELFSIAPPLIIRNAVNTDVFFPVERQSEVFTFIHVSMMQPLKNVEGILEAMVRVSQEQPACKLVLVGPAPAALQAYAASLGLTERVEWTGALTYNDVAGRMQAANALVHFSNYENLPCVINEALCCGLPVISSDVGGVAELVHTGNGKLVPPGNVQELAAAMLHVIRNRSNYQAATIAADAATAFSYQNIGQQHLDIYHSVIHSQQR